MLLMLFWQEAWMKKQHSVQGKSGFSCHTLLNLQVLLSLTRQTMKEAGVKTSHQHSVSVCCCTGVGRSRMQKQPFVKGEGWEDSRVLLGRLQGAFPESLLLWKEGIYEQGEIQWVGIRPDGVMARSWQLFSTNSHNFLVMENGVPSCWGSGGSLVCWFLYSEYSCVNCLPLLYPLLLILLLLLSLSYFIAVSICLFQ